MALASGLYLKQIQSLAMTPQLVQSIRLLQMNRAELDIFIAEEIEKNPLLELAPPASDEDPVIGDFSPASLETDDFGKLDRGEILIDTIDATYADVFPDDAGGAHANDLAPLARLKSMSGGQNGEPYDLEDFTAGPISLRDHLNQQIPFIVKSPVEALIAAALTDHLDDAGYMVGNMAEIAATLGTSPAEVGLMLARLQEVEPPGLFARSLSECLTIQLRARGKLDPAMERLIGNLELLARRDFASLKRLCGLSEGELSERLAEIRRLDPKPGSAFVNGPTEIVIPDIIVRAGANGAWLVELNPESLPQVLVNNDYHATILKSPGTSKQDRVFLGEALQNANWLVRSLDQRARTVLKVAGEIVRRQDGFLAHGVDHLSPLNLKTVADAIKMHESTVSRVTSNKYILTPRGLFELKYFFTVSIGSVSGQTHSAEAVRNRIRMMILAETAQMVLSDDDVVKQLKESGIELARRTVAKYRDALNIPSSVQRKREKRVHAKTQEASDKTENLDV